MTPPFDFSAFEKESARLLASMQRSTENIAAYEQQVRAGRVGTASIESRTGSAQGLVDQAGKEIDSNAIRQRGVATDELIARQRQLSVAEAGSTQAERTMAQAMAQSAGNMRQNGALTNEFIEGAKRGTVSVRELGAQVSGTIAKFGGWILAGSAVYFAFDALKFLKAGAIDASSGVTQMSRVINNLDVHKATEEVSELSKEFNLPIGTVTETAFQMGKAYHNQAEAMLATKSALYAVKVGEIDAATASRYLISIIQGFHLPAKDTASLFDELLAAQKHYAVDLPSLMQGVGRAAGAFRAAGGDVHGLIALITTLQHVSGQTGTVIGTAIQRSPHFIGTPTNQSILEQFGINPALTPKHTIEDLYKEAIEAAKGKSGKVQREISEGLFGPKYGARVGSFLLQNKKLHEEVFGFTSPANAKGTAQAQLQITLEKTSELITRIGTELERLGAGLALGHLVDSLGLILRFLDFSLARANDLVSAFDRLPGGMQTFLAYLIQAALYIRLFSRLNLGQTIAGGAGATPGGVRGGAAALFGYGSQTAFAKQARDDFITEQKDLQKKLLSTQTSRASYQTRESLALNRQQVAEQGLIVSPAGSEQAALAAKQAAAARAEVDASYQRIYGLALDEEAIAIRLAAVQGSVAATRKRIIGGLDTQATIAEANRLGYPIPAAVGAAAGADQAAAAVNETGGKVGLVGRGFGKLDGAFSKLGGGFNQLVGAAGSLIFGIFIFSYILTEMEGAFNEVEAELQKLQAPAQTAKIRAEHAKSYAHPHSFTPGEFFVGFSNFLSPFGSNFLGTGTDPIARREQEELQISRLSKDEEKAEKFRLGRNEAAPFRFVGQITRDIENIKKSGESRSKIREALEKYEAEITSSYQAEHPSNKGAVAIKRAEAALNEAKADSAKNKDLVQALQTLKSSQISERLSAVAGQVGGAEGVPFNAAEAKKLGLIYQAQLQKIGSAKDPKSIGELNQARQAYFSGVQQAIAGELQYATDLARTSGERNRAYAQALSRYRTFGASSNAELQKQQQLVSGLKQQRENLPEGSKAVQELDKRIKIESTRLEQIVASQSAKQRFVKDIIQKLRVEEYQANSALRGAEEGALEALTADPIKQTEEKLRFLGKEIAQAIKVYGHDSQQVFQLITEQRNAQQQLVQAQLGLLQAQGNLASAGILEQVPKEKAALSGPGGLLAQLRFEEAHRGAFDPKTIIELEAQIKQAEAQLAHDIEAEANQLADARFGIREARANAAGNPAQAARIAVEKAKYDVAHALTPLEKLTAQQSLIQALASKRDAVANARLESIQFEASIAKISTQEEITQLETLLHTYKLSITARRHLREQIHSLKSQLATEGQGFDLNVGDFALPTAYDIRRAVLGGGSGPGATIHQTNHFNVQNYSSDPNVVGKAIGQVLGGAATSAARSAGVA